MTTMDQYSDYPMDKKSKPAARWSFVHSNVVPSNVTVARARTTRNVNLALVNWKEIQGSVLRPANNPAAWYESKDRSKPSVSSF